MAILHPSRCVIPSFSCNPSFCFQSCPTLGCSAGLPDPLIPFPFSAFTSVFRGSFCFSAFAPRLSSSLSKPFLAAADGASTGPIGSGVLSHILDKFFK